MTLKSSIKFMGYSIYFLKANIEVNLDFCQF